MDATPVLGSTATKQPKSFVGFAMTLNQNVLKLVAIVTMTIDHSLVILFDSKDCLGTYIGRVAMPLFLFLVAYNYLYNTRNSRRYFCRLMAWGLLSQVPYVIAFNTPRLFNVLVTLGLLAGIFWLVGPKLKRSHLWFYIVSLALLASFLLLCLVEVQFSFEYGFAGLFVGVAMLSFLSHRSFDYLLFLIIGLYFLNGTPQEFVAIALYLPLILALSVKVPFEFKLLPRYKHLFYAYYPLHLILLVGIKRLLF